MTAQNPSLSEAQKQVAKQLARIKGGHNRWKGKTKAQISAEMRRVALAKANPNQSK
jgi:hypothetical protein